MPSRGGETGNSCGAKAKRQRRILTPPAAYTPGISDSCCPFLWLSRSDVEARPSDRSQESRSIYIIEVMKLHKSKAVAKQNLHGFI